MSKWDRFRDNRDWFRSTGVALFLLAVVALLTEPWHQLRTPGGVVFALLGQQCFMARSFFGRLADLQSRIDMKRVARGQDPE